MFCGRYVTHFSSSIVNVPLFYSDARTASRGNLHENVCCVIFSAISGGNGLISALAPCTRMYVIIHSFHMEEKLLSHFGVIIHIHFYSEDGV